VARVKTCNRVPRLCTAKQAPSAHAPYTPPTCTRIPPHLHAHPPPTCTRITVTATLKLRTSSLRMFLKCRATSRSIWSFRRPSGIWVPLQRLTSSKTVLAGGGGAGRVRAYVGGGSKRSWLADKSDDTFKRNRPLPRTPPPSQAPPLP
jgi:hypothetical protein